MKNLMNKIRKSNKGFTLVELIIVVAIIAVLSAVVAPQYIKYVERSRQGVDASTLNEIKHIVEIEAGTIDGLEASTVTITVSGKSGSIAGDHSFAAGKAAITNVTSAANTPVAFKSSNSNYTYKLSVAADGKVTWGTNSAAKIAKLQSGTATATDAAES